MGGVELLVACGVLAAATYLVRMLGVSAFGISAFGISTSGRRASGMDTSAPDAGRSGASGSGADGPGADWPAAGESAERRPGSSRRAASELGARPSRAAADGLRLGHSVAVLLAAVAASSAFYDGQHLADWTRPAGVLLGCTAAFLRAPLTVVVLVAGAGTAMLRMLT